MSTSTMAQDRGSVGIVSGTNPGIACRSECRLPCVSLPRTCKCSAALSSHSPREKITSHIHAMPQRAPAPLPEIPVCRIAEGRERMRADWGRERPTCACRGASYAVECGRVEVLLAWARIPPTFDNRAGALWRGCGGMRIVATVACNIPYTWLQPRQAAQPGCGMALRRAASKRCS